MEGRGCQQEWAEGGAKLWCGCGDDWVDPMVSFETREALVVVLSRTSTGAVMGCRSPGKARDFGLRDSPQRAG